VITAVCLKLESLTNRMSGARKSSCSGKERDTPENQEGTPITCLTIRRTDELQRLWKEVATA
jgi:hypothetical protein